MLVGTVKSFVLCPWSLVEYERSRFLSDQGLRTRDQGDRSRFRPDVQVDFRDFAVGGFLDLEELHWLEIECLGDEAVGEDLLRNVEPRRDVVVELPRETDLVLRRGELLHQRLHV